MSLGDNYVVRPDGVIVPCVNGTQGVWLVDLAELLGSYGEEAQMPTDLAPELEKSECERVCALGSAAPDVDELELLHRRSGHTVYSQKRYETNL